MRADGDPQTSRLPKNSVDWLGPPQAPVVAQVVDVSVHDSGIGAAAGAQRRHKVVQAARDVADLDREELCKRLLRVRLPVLACASGIQGSLSVDWHSELALRSARVNWAEEKDCKTQGGAARNTCYSTSVPAVWAIQRSRGQPMSQDRTWHNDRVVSLELRADLAGSVVGGQLLCKVRALQVSHL